MGIQNVKSVLGECEFRSVSILINSCESLILSIHLNGDANHVYVNWLVKLVCLVLEKGVDLMTDEILVHLHLLLLSKSL